jgi:hypothetical protein
MMLEEAIQRYVSELVSAYPDIESVWLIGSRANGTSRPESDWDLIAFGSQSIFQSLRSDVRFHHEHIDLVVVYDGDTFEKPWGEREKGGSLSGWRWLRQSATRAVYRATKPIFNERGEEEFEVKVTQCVALCVYDRAAK